MPPSPPQDTRGILHPHSGRFRLARRAPSPDLGVYVDRYWSVSWDLRGRAPFEQETLPHPSVHLVFEPGGATVYGVMTRRFARLLEGRDWALGVKFHPGGFAAFHRGPAAALTDREPAIGEVFGPEGESLAREVFAAPEDPPRIAAIERFLRERLPAVPDPRQLLAMRLARAMLDVPADTRVDDLARRFGISPRTAQRLFRRYVGVHPKWVLQRYRLHEAAERIAAGETDLARLALDVGYFDQAHFGRDFKAAVGRTPAEYAEECAALAAEPRVA